MTKALVLGAGLVTRPLVRYLLDQPDFHVTVASRTVSKAVALIDGHPNGTALPLLADDQDKLAELIREHDLTISLLPAPLHPVVAKLCIEHRKHMVTTSYVSPAMRALDGAAREAGVMILNEIGVDPGIDHMSAMRVIDDVRSRGGEVVSFKSYCGGLPAPDCNDNPFGYKFSWSPRAVCTAGKNSACFREDGKQVDIPGPELFACTHRVHVDAVGELEAYPNRDSLAYIDVYGLKGIETMFRGTFRYIGWCETLKAIVDLGLLDETPVTYPAGTTYAQYMAKCSGTDGAGGIRSAVAAKLALDETSPVLDRLEWLGLFSDETIAITDKETTALDILGARMEQTMKYKPGERDMIVLCHYFLAKFPSAPDERITSTLIDYGRPNGDSSMARTVSLPAAIASKLILSGSIMVPGVHIPVAKEIYNPVLDELAKLDIRCIEKTEPIAS
ncbi:MAG: saccharopine dehydrogenase NADP-binding domain-containing protein [Planctomycetes bacterium]|nr:saccharopine dehydrogenase NADP-binding domain-containing protein [Planctomycetota bacterium]